MTSSNHRHDEQHGHDHAHDVPPVAVAPEAASKTAHAGHDHDGDHVHSSPAAPVACGHGPCCDVPTSQPTNTPARLAVHGELQIQVRVRGMDCSEEVAVIRKALEPLAGITGITPDIAQGIVTVNVTKDGPTIATVVGAIQRSGLGAEAVGAGPRQPESTWVRLRREILTSIAGAAIILGAVIHAGVGGASAVFANEGMPVVSRVLYGLAILVAVGPLLPRAWGAIRSLRLDMNVLMVIAVVGAVALGDWMEAATVGTLFALSLVLESWTARRAGRAIADLMKSAPHTARVRSAPGGVETDVPVAEVAIGAVVIVRPGETIPIDGTILSGTSSINQAPITGESVPVAKTVGGPVFAGCVNGEGALEIETTQPAGDTMLARIARMVAESQARRGGAERWIDRFAQIYTPIVMVLAVAVAVIPGAITGNWAWWLYQSLVLLVIACPCALVISVPVCIVAGIATAARAGVIVKGGAALEVAAKLKAIAFDKTGTLTVGRPGVVEVIPFDGVTGAQVVQAAAALESRSEHPVAHAIMEHAVKLGLAINAESQVTAVPGKGIRADSGAWAGSLAWAIERGTLPTTMREKLEAALASGSTVIVVGTGDRVLGGITCRDQLRTETKEALKGLQAIGVHRLIMLSGDAESVAKHVANEVGITESYGSLLPDAKVAKVASLADEAAPMAMVGDGLNDAPALARANLGVAMGSATAATLETADVALLSNDLRRLPWMVTHARRVMAIMSQNVVISLGTKIVFVGLALSGHGSLWIAIAADTGVSLLVVLNALRLLRR